LASVASTASRAAVKRLSIAGSAASWSLAASVSAPLRKSGAPSICFLPATPYSLPGCVTSFWPASMNAGPFSRRATMSAQALGTSAAVASSRPGIGRCRNCV
jgi:hypothetical protein